MDFKTVQNKLLENPEFRREYQKRDLAFDMAKMITKARIKKGMSQTQLADYLGTKQPSIARFESGTQVPSLTTLNKMAEVFNTELIAPQFEFLIPDSRIKFDSPSPITKLMAIFSSKRTDFRLENYSFDSDQSLSPESFNYSFNS